MNDLEIKRGDVFFCQGSPDAIESEERKTRPVVVIQNDVGNVYSPTVIVANMTSKTDRRLYPFQFDVALPDGRPVSRVLCEQIRTVDKSRLLEKVYTLNEAELRVLNKCLAVSFGLTAPVAAQEGPRTRRNDPDDIFHHLTQKGLSVAVCPLPVLGQVNITIDDGKDICLARNIGARSAGIVDEIADMKDKLEGVAP